MSTRGISLPAINRTVPLAAYVRAVKLAKANPTRMFDHGLASWWPTSGERIVQQFRDGMHQRINERVACTARGISHD